MSKKQFVFEAQINNMENVVTNLERDYLKSQKFCTFQENILDQIDKLKSLLTSVEKGSMNNEKELTETRKYLQHHLPIILEDEINKAMMEVIGDQKKYKKKLNGRIEQMQKSVLDQMNTEA